MKRLRQQRCLSMSALLWLFVAVDSALAGQSYIREVRPEAPAAREARHRQVAERRNGPIVIVHRGANAIAPENSLEDCNAAMDYGADGCEVDVRRTRDGVLVLFHDDMLDRLLEDVGEISEVTFAELMRIRPRLRFGRVLPCHGPPTFAALMELARTRAMLLHLDIKEPGLEADIAALLTQADVWDHVVSVNTANATNLLRNPRLKLLQYKAGLFEGRRDVDPALVRAALPGPGEMIIVDDPRVASRALGRPPYQPVPLSKSLCVEQPFEASRPLPVPVNRPPEAAVSLSPREKRVGREPERGAIPKTNSSSPPPSPPSVGTSAGMAWMPSPTNFNLHAFFQSLGAPKRDRVLSLLASDFAEATEPNGDAEYQRRRTEQIAERAWAARAAGSQRKTSRLVALLERQVRRRSLHRDWRYQGLDGVMAVRSLAQLRATESAPVLIEAFRRVDPELEKIADPQWSNYPLVWRDFRFKMALLPALGELDCPASRKFLWEYLAMDEARLRELAPPEFEEATKALLRHDLSEDELKALLGHSNSSVRGTAVLECLDHPTRRRTRALKSVAPWALALPRGVSRGVSPK